MSTTTTNYNLIKPELTDTADITATNGNWDTIDAELKKASVAEANAKQYTDQKVASIPTPDVSGQINTHNSDSTAHADIRKAIADAKTYTDQKFNSIPTPDVSGQINTHNTDGNSHADIRAELANKAPAYTYGTTDLEAGVTALESGKLHFVYE